MDQIRIRGGNPLKGSINIAGAKNAALPLMTVSLLTDEEITLSNLPHLADISTMSHLLSDIGVDIAMDGNVSGGHSGRTFNLKAKDILNTTAQYDLVRKMRASILVLGPLLARCGKARVSLPGGCAIGTRPVDLHLRALEQLGAEIELSEGYIEAEAPKGLSGAHVIFPTVTVGGTENILMAATLAKGKTVIGNAAREPEVSDLAHCLIAMGARIDGVGSDTLTVEGVDRLHGAEHAVLSDRIESATHAVATAITGGTVDLIGAQFDLIRSVSDILMRAGVEISKIDSGLRIKRKMTQFRA